MKKQKILEAVNAQPNEVNLEVLFEKLIFMEKVEQGLKEIEEGKTIPHQDVVDHFNKKWK